MYVTSMLGLALGEFHAPIVPFHQQSPGFRSKHVFFAAAGTVWMTVFGIMKTTTSQYQDVEGSHRSVINCNRKRFN